LIRKFEVYIPWYSSVLEVVVANIGAKPKFHGSEILKIAASMVSEFSIVFPVGYKEAKYGKNSE